MDEKTLTRLRASSVSRPVPEPTEQDRRAYVDQLRSLGADEATVRRLTRGIQSS